MVVGVEALDSAPAAEVPKSSYWTPNFQKASNHGNINMLSSWLQVYIANFLNQVAGHDPSRTRQNTTRAGLCHY